VATLVHRTSDDRLDIGAVSLVEQPFPGSALDLPTEGESPRKRLDEITLEPSGVRERALAKGRSHPVHCGSDQRRTARPTPIDRGLVDLGRGSDRAHPKGGVARARELEDRGIEDASHYLLAASPEDPLGATR
jgi:hypothetical protein